MMYKKGPRDDMANYISCDLPPLPRIQAAIGRRGASTNDGVGGPTTGHPGWIQASSRMLGQRVCPEMVHRHGLREGRQVVIVTFIYYSAAFDTESQLFLGSHISGNRGQLDESSAHCPCHSR